MLLHINVDMSDAEHPVRRTSFRCILKYHIWDNSTKAGIWKGLFLFWIFFFFSEVGIGDNLGVSQHQNV